MAQKKYILGIVVTTSPTCSRYRMVVFPAPSKPRIKILISLVPNRLLKMLEKNPPGESACRDICSCIVYHNESTAKIKKSFKSSSHYHGLIILDILAVVHFFHG